ncbi:MAG: Glutathione S-transferase [Pseudomonadota bacterium]|jgi:glutathione S-transferase
MPLKLYYAPGTCSLVPHIALELIGQPFEAQLVKMHKGEHRSPEFLTVNPAGQVPVLQDGDETITQIIAITLYLDALHPQAGLFPQELLARTHAIETLAWLNNTVHTTFNRVFKPEGAVDGEEMQAAVRAKGKQGYAALMERLQDKVVAARAAGNDYLNGASIGVVDAYALTVIRWSQLGGMVPEQQWPQLWDYAERVAAQPAAQRAMERERIRLRAQPLV